MIFAMSDIHGHYELMKKRIDQLIPYLAEKNNRLILLGDFIDRGDSSFQCLKAAFDLQDELGTDKVIVLKGNHEEWFREFLDENENIWLAEDDDFCTSGTFLLKEQFEELKKLTNRNEQTSFLRKCIKTNHKELLSWMKRLKAFYETETQIFVHAGIDEDIPEEELEWCTIGTPEYVLTGKYPPSKGHFYKDIIAGHVAAAVVADDPNFEGIYFDGESHFYIDGSTTNNNKLLCLAYDEEKKKYYELMEDGTFKKIGR